MDLSGGSISQFVFTLSANAGTLWDYALYLLVASTTGLELLRASNHPHARYILRFLRLEEVVAAGGGGNSFVETALANGEMGPHHLEFQGGELALVFDEPLPVCPLADLLIEPASGEVQSPEDGPPQTGG